MKPGLAPRPVKDRIFDGVSMEPTSGCWLWTKYCNRLGYGMFDVPGRGMNPVYRISYEIFKGAIPAKFDIDHLCRNTGCVNPDHLEAVSHRENILRGIGPTAINALKTHCLKGHPLTPDNLRPSLRNERACKECANVRNRAYLKRRREKLVA